MVRPSQWLNSDGKSCTQRRISLLVLVLCAQPSCTDFNVASAPRNTTAATRAEALKQRYKLDENQRLWFVLATCHTAPTKGEQRTRAEPMIGSITVMIIQWCYSGIVMVESFPTAQPCHVTNKELYTALLDPPYDLTEPIELIFKVKHLPQDERRLSHFAFGMHVRRGGRQSVRNCRYEVPNATSEWKSWHRIQEV